MSGRRAKRSGCVGCGPSVVRKGGVGGVADVAVRPSAVSIISEKRFGSVRLSAEMSENEE